MDKFIDWLNKEIEDLQYKPNVEFALSEAIRIRQMYINITKGSEESENE